MERWEGDMTGTHLFSTSLFLCRVTWSTDAIIRVECLSLSQEFGPNNAAVPSFVPILQEAIQAHVNGGVPDYSEIPLRVDGSIFARRVRERCRAIPWGEVCTYGEIAEYVGSKGAAQAVGRVMASNPFPLIVPCHRVVGANGRLGGFSAGAGVSLKRDLLAREGCRSIPMQGDLLKGQVLRANRHL